MIKFSKTTFKINKKLGRSYDNGRVQNNRSGTVKYNNNRSDRTQSNDEKET